MAKFEQDGFTLIDVSHKVEDGMQTYQGLPTPIICDYLSREASKSHYQEGTTFQIGMVTMCSNTGTYVDVPFHRYEDGEDLSEISLSKLANLDAIKIIVPEATTGITLEHIQTIDVYNKAVLFETNWSRHWGTDKYFENHPFVTEEAAIYLRNQGAVFVGIDSFNIDDVRGNARPCHSTLLKAGIPICEHMMQLSELPNSGFKFFAVPVKMKGMGTFPVRAFGILEKAS
jgi:kynurenine formamidase